MSSADLRVCWASGKEDIERAQRFRFKVFTEEYTPHFPQAHLGLDQDAFDHVCDHLLIIENTSNQIVGSYRLIPPKAAQQVGSMYCDLLFDLQPLQSIRGSIVEMDRSCIDKKYRNGSTILYMWKMIFQYMKTHGHEYIIGCSSLSMQDGGHAAVALHQRLHALNHFSTHYAIKAKTPIDLGISASTAPVLIPPILKGYLNVGAKVCSEPAFDQLFTTADYLTILKMSDMKPNYVKRFSR